MELYELIATYGPDAVSVHDLEGRYRWASPAFRDLLGFEPDDLVGRDAYDLFHPDDVASIQISHETVVALPTTYTVQYRIKQADGTYRWVETNSRVVEQEQAIVAITRPIDRRRSALDALAAERLIAERLREIARERHQFLTAVAHRARQPLTVVAGLVDLLAARWEELDPGQIADLFVRVRRNTDRLRRLVEEVTDAEQLARRARAVHARPIDLERTVRTELASITDADGPITVDIAAGSVVFADYDLLRVALRILLANASGHTPVGTPVWIRFEREMEGTVVVVEDAGPGIEPGGHERVFAAFARADEDAPDPGLGLGLSTLTEIAAAHHGRAWVEDRHGGGASFRLLLPYAASYVPLTTGAAAPTVHLPKTVLVVDDDASVLEVIRTTLEADGWNVRTARNGADALGQVQSSPPDVIILDVLMPGLDGREVARTLRADPATRMIPIVVCSALDSVDDRWAANIAGADAFVAKPFDVEALTTELSRALRSRRSITE